MSSTQLFIVSPNSKVCADVLRVNVMLPGEMGHQNRVIVYTVSSAFRTGHHVEGKKGQAIIFTRVAQRSFFCEYYGPALLLDPDGVTCAVRFKFTLQLR
jgi:hypothetical protein